VTPHLTLCIYLPPTQTPEAGPSQSSPPTSSRTRSRAAAAAHLLPLPPQPLSPLFPLLSSPSVDYQGSPLAPQASTPVRYVWWCSYGLRWALTQDG